MGFKIDVTTLTFLEFAMGFIPVWVKYNNFHIMSFIGKSLILVLVTLGSVVQILLQKL